MKTATLIARGLVLVLILTVLVGCRRQHEERRGTYSAPRNAAEAARAWPGKKMDFVDEHGEKLLRLRERRTGYRVFGPGLQPLGEVRAEGERVVMADRTGQPVFVFEPADLTAEDLPGKPPKGFVLHKAGEKEAKGERLGFLGTGMTRLEGDAPLWMAYDAEGDPLMTWSPVEEGVVDLHFVLQGSGSEVRWRVSAQGDKGARKVTARPDEGNTHGDAVLEVVSQTLTPEAAAPVLLTRLDPLVRAGMLLAIRGPQTDEQPEQDSKED